MATNTQDVWKQFSRQLLQFLRRRVDDPVDAEDILQDVFLKVHTRMHTLKDTGRLAPWLYRIARNALIDHERRRRPTLPPPEELPDAQSTPDNEAEGHIARYLRGLVSRLPPAYSQAVAWYELEGVKQQEIARRLGMSLSGAKSRVQRGRQMLKQALLDCCHFEFDRTGRIIDFRGRQACCVRCTECASPTP